jgi:uncharacterized damage-inducible protein DinB
MRAADLERLFDYSYWANDKLFGVISRLTADEFTREVCGSYGSVRNTLVHMLSAEWGWLDRCGGEPRGPKLDPDDYPTIQSVIETWERVEGYMRPFLARLEDEDLARDVEFSLGGPPHIVPLGDLMHHAAVHGAHHRGQLSLILRELGHTPGNYDMLIYCIEARNMSGA